MPRLEDFDIGIFFCRWTLAKLLLSTYLQLVDVVVEVVEVVVDDVVVVD